MRPLVLLSNDDGIDSPYLAALAAGLEKTTEVVVVAPERERSAASHSITLHKPLRLRQHGPNRFSISGNPVDCVYIGLVKLTQRRPALVLSGLNNGFNLGADVFYSGTVAAAAEGALRGVSAMALSMGRGEGGNLAEAIRFATALILSTLAHPLPPRTLLNVNIPPQPDGRYRWTRLGERLYHDAVDERDDPRGRRYYWIGGGVADFANEPGSDCEAVDCGIISVTPLRLDLTAHDLLIDEPPWIVDGFTMVS